MSTIESVSLFDTLSQWGSFMRCIRMVLVAISAPRSENETKERFAPIAQLVEHLICNINVMCSYFLMLTLRC